MKAAGREAPDPVRRTIHRTLLAAACTLAVCAPRADAAEGELRGVVVDQTGLPLPGARVQLQDGASVVVSVTTTGDGSFALDGRLAGATVVVSLTGFQTVTVARRDSSRIVLPLARATDATEVTAAGSDISSPNATTIDSRMPAPTVRRLLTARQNARDAFPLLPSVVRGPDGILRIDGARPHEAPLLLDGFNVTDPATGVSAINLAVESVRSVEVLRDPTDVTFGGALGPLALVDTQSGGDAFKFGVQGFVPRLRSTGGGVGRLEGFFPRAHAGGSAASGRVRYFASAEYYFERIPVPGVTTSSGSPDTKQVSTSLFARLDFQLSQRHTLSVEGLVFPGRKTLFGLSPLRTESASPVVEDRDVFAGLAGRHLLGEGNLLTVRVGVLSHRTEITPSDDAPAVLSPAGWSGGSFSSLARTSGRLHASVAWQRSVMATAGRHDVKVEATFDAERLQGTVSELPVLIVDAQGRPVREIGFGRPASIAARARGVALAARDVWKPSERVQLDAGVRADWSSLGGGITPAGRAGVRYALDANARTVVKAGVGSFVGTIPLSVPAFSAFPARFDRRFDPGSGELVRSGTLRPLVGELSLPRSLAANLKIERQIAPGWDALVGASLRRASRLATLDLRAEEGTLAVRSDGRSAYWEMGAAVRRAWGDGNQVFISYTRSSARGDLNDFATLFAAGDTEVLQPRVTSRLAADAPHRWLAWGTFNLPAGFVLSPALEWHSGFPYSVLDARRDYAGPPNSSSFPNFVSLDVVLLKTVTVWGKRFRFGVQLFNATNHFNPRDVFAVEGAAQFGNFTNSVGPRLRGVMTVAW